MITLYHAPQSRSSRLVTLIDELQAPVEIKTVQIRRLGQETSGPDPKNPHPEGKVPFLTDGDSQIRESAAIILYLTDKFPQAGLGPLPGDAKRGEYLSWLFWYQGVVEPLLICRYTGLTHPAFTSSWRDETAMADRLSEALSKGPYLLGEHYSAADLLLHSPFAWMPAATPDRPEIHDWVARCAARPSLARTQAHDAEAMAGA